MRYYALYNLVGIAVGDDYPWHDTLFINGVVNESETDYNTCAQKIRVSYRSELPMEDVRFIGDGNYISPNAYVDKEYGVRIEKLNDGWNLIVSQECNEWLVIAMELSLLATNHTWIHAAALEKDGSVLLLPSWGGVGKTATVCRFVRNYGWRLLGDDLIIVGEQGARPFLKPFVIYPYHRDLFPELFSQGEKKIVTNLAVSSMMSRAIPTVKRVLRMFPRVLAFLRKHNPQSMRVLPHRLFTPEQLSEGGSPAKMVWLERSMKQEVHQEEITAEMVASKAVTVSSVELFAAKLENVYHMCGCGMVTYDEVFGKMHKIIMNTARLSACHLLEIPASVSIMDVGEIIYQKIN